MLTALKDKLNGKVPAGAKRSGQWPAARRAHLEKFPTCAACGGSKKVEVHHIKPFHLDPALELDPTNFISLCEGNGAVNCHLNFGHLQNFKLENKDVVTDALAWLEKLRTVRLP